MPVFDLSIEELKQHQVTLPRPADIQEFWAGQLAQARRLASPPTFETFKQDVYRSLAVDDVTFSGAHGHPIRAWLMRPMAVDGRLPCLVHFVGYGGGRSLPVDHAL